MTKRIVTHDADDVVPVIRQAMANAGVSQIRLAAQMGISAVQMNRLLRGGCNISLKQLYTMLAYLHIDIVVSPAKAAWTPTEPEQ
jgi:transcriptional regulator with XRE-family HTH domain